MKKQQSLFAVLVLAAGIHQAMADAPTQINITGNVIASPCTVDTANSNLNVDLGIIPAADMASAGSYGGIQQNFSVVLKDCPSSTTKVTATFSGQQYAADSNLFKNTGTATNLGVKIKPDAAVWTDITVNPNQSTWRKDVSSSTHAVSFSFNTRPYTTTGGVTPGTIISTMQMAFTYQ